MYPEKDEEVLGIVTGNTVRTKHIGKDILAGLKNIVGRELQEYNEMLSDARKETLAMVKKAEKLGDSQPLKP